MVSVRVGLADVDFGVDVDVGLVGCLLNSLSEDVTGKKVLE